MSAPSDPIIRVHDVTAGYDETAILDHVSFDVRRGEIFVILGGSGSGKSTLLKHMIGLEPPLAGSILIDGDDIVTAEDGLRQSILRRFGVMYQSGALFGSMTLAENVRLPLEEFTDLEDDEIALIARMKLAMVGLDAFTGHLPAEVSGGMQKRAAIARALALDPITSAGLDALILRLARNLGATFVIVSHELPSIFAIADRVIMVDRVRRGIVAEGDPRKLRDSSPDPWVRQFFRREPEVLPA
jgi:phospholipid/cholesterol/gamma-HCH transport system ATP-binding protein